MLYPLLAKKIYSVIWCHENYAKKNSKKVGTIYEVCLNYILFPWTRMNMKNWSTYINHTSSWSYSRCSCIPRTWIKRWKKDLEVEMQLNLKYEYAWNRSLWEKKSGEIDGQFFALIVRLVVLIKSWTAASIKSLIQVPRTDKSYCCWSSKQLDNWVTRSS